MTQNRIGLVFLGVFIIYIYINIHSRYITTPLIRLNFLTTMTCCCLLICFFGNRWPGTATEQMSHNENTLTLGRHVPRTGAHSTAALLAAETLGLGLGISISRLGAVRRHHFGCSHCIVTRFTCGDGCCLSSVFLTELDYHNVIFTCTLLMVAIALGKQIQNCFFLTFVEYMPLKGAYLLDKLVARRVNFQSLWCET